MITFLIIGCVILFLLIAIKVIFSEKCKFWKNCEWYDSQSRVCNKNAGDYYGLGRKAGCFRTMAEKKMHKEN